MKVLMVRLAKHSRPMDEDGGEEDLAWHKAIAQSIKSLDQLASERSLAALSSFISEDPDNIYDSIDDELEAEKWSATLPPVKWFDPQSAARTVDGLLNAIEANLKVLGTKSPAKVIIELRNLSNILSYAIRKKARFRFYEQF